MDISLPHSLNIFLQQATTNVNSLNTITSQHSTHPLSPAEISNIIDPLGKGNVARIGDDYAVVHGSRSERKIGLMELLHLFHIHPMDISGAFTQAEINPTANMPSAWPPTPDRHDNAQDPGTPIPLLTSPINLADLARQSSLSATEVIVRGEGWDGLLGLVAVVGKEASGQSKDTVLLDSGANICIFNNKKWFRNLTTLNISIGSIG